MHRVRCPVWPEAPRVRMWPSAGQDLDVPEPGPSNAGSWYREQACATQNDWQTPKQSWQENTGHGRHGTAGKMSEPWNDWIPGVLNVSQMIELCKNFGRAFFSVGPVRMARSR